MRPFTALCLLSLLALPASADTVYLSNGKTFEGVVATDLGDSVRISIEAGEITLPASQVQRIERGATPLTEFRQRRAELDAVDPAAAPEWLALARWAHGQGLSGSARTAALTAARLDSGLDGLAPLLSEHGYVQDPETGGWVSHAEYQRSNGMVRVDGEWVSQQALEAQSLASQRQSVAQRQDERLDRLSRVVEMAALAQLAAAQRPPEPEPQPVYHYPVAVFPGHVLARHHKRDGSFIVKPVDFSAIANHLPGSRLPLRSDRGP